MNDSAMRARNLGKALRRLRKDAGLTLSELSRATSIPISTMSKVETGQMSLTYEKLLALSQGLGVDVGEIIAADTTEAEQPPMARRAVTRATKGRRFQTPAYNYEYLGTDLKHKRMTPIIITVTAKSVVDIGDLSHHPGEEFLYVLSGEIEFHSEFYETIVLAAGDSIYFDSGMGHASVSVGSRDATILDVCYVDARSFLPHAKDAGISEFFHEMLGKGISAKPAKRRARQGT